MYQVVTKCWKFASSFHPRLTGASVILNIILFHRAKAKKSVRHRHAKFSGTSGELIELYCDKMLKSVQNFISCFSLHNAIILFLNNFFPNLLDEGVRKDRASAKQSVLRCLCLPHRSRNSCSMAEFRAECLTYAHKHQAPVAPRTPNLSKRDACSDHT